MRINKGMILRLIIGLLFFAAAFMSVKYSFIILAVGSGSKFFLFWDFVGLLLILAGTGIMLNVFSRFPKWLNVTLIAATLTGLIVVGILVGRILSCYDEKAEPGCDYIIVLGAQVKPDGPSVVLNYRLEAALEYLNANPGTKCIVSGAQGSNEPCTEAFAMKEYLVSHGIADERIILEEKAVNTRQNISYSREFIPEGSKVGIVTNRFHMRRALYLCKKAGLDDVSPVNAYSVRLYEPNNVIREVFGLIKDFIF